MYMKSEVHMKRLFAVLLALLIASSGATFAQSKTSLNIVCNVTGAEVFINGRQAGYATPNFSFLVPRGKVQIRVQKNGFKTFETIVNVANQPVNLNVALEPIGAPAPAPVIIQPPQIIQHSISVNANIHGADVIINGNTAGKTPFSAQVPPGSYSITVRAPGYLDFNQNVVVNGPTQVNAILQGMMYGLVVNANVQGADVFINGNPAGKTPYNGQVPGGAYNVTVRAIGYQDFNQSVVVGGPTQVNAILQPSFASWQVILPDAFVNRDLKGGHWSQIQIYVDGVPQKSPNGAVSAGRHVFRMTSGGMAFEAQVDLQPGRTYTLEPTFGFTIR
jgi:hypothetical protein